MRDRDEVRREIEEKRAELGEKLEELAHRADEVRERIRDRISINRRVEERPWAMFGISAATGFGLYMLTHRRQIHRYETRTVIARQPPRSSDDLEDTREEARREGMLYGAAQAMLMALASGVARAVVAKYIERRFEKEAGVVH